MRAPGPAPHRCARIWVQPSSARRRRRQRRARLLSRKVLHKPPVTGAVLRDHSARGEPSQALAGARAIRAGGLGQRAHGRAGAPLQRRQELALRGWAIDRAPRLGWARARDRRGYSRHRIGSINRLESRPLGLAASGVSQAAIWARTLSGSSRMRSRTSRNAVSSCRSMARSFNAGRADPRRSRPDGKRRGFARESAPGLALFGRHRFHRSRGMGRRRSPRERQAQGSGAATVAKSGAASG